MVDADGECEVVVLVVGEDEWVVVGEDELVVVGEDELVVEVTLFVGGDVEDWDKVLDGCVVGA